MVFLWNSVFGVRLSAEEMAVLFQLQWTVMIVVGLHISLPSYLFVCFLFQDSRFKITLLSHQRNLRNLSFQRMTDWMGPFFRCSLCQFLVGFVVFPSLCLIVMQPSTIQHSFATLPLEAKCAKASKEPS